MLDGMLTCSRAQLPEVRGAATASSESSGCLRRSRQRRIGGAKQVPSQRNLGQRSGGLLPRRTSGPAVQASHDCLATPAIVPVWTRFHVRTYLPVQAPGRLTMRGRQGNSPTPAGTAGRLVALVATSREVGVRRPESSFDLTTSLDGPAAHDRNGGLSPRAGRSPRTEADGSVPASWPLSAGTYRSVATAHATGSAGWLAALLRALCSAP